MKLGTISDLDFFGAGYQGADDALSIAPTAPVSFAPAFDMTKLSADDGTAFHGGHDDTPPALSDYNTSLPSAGYNATAFWVLDQLESSGNPNLPAYLDPAGIPSIGVGFNLRVDAIANAVMTKMGIGQFDHTTRNQIKAAVAQDYSSNTDLRSALNTIMASWSASHGGGRTTFAFLNSGEAIDVYGQVIPTYEHAVDQFFGGGIPESFERIALVSLSYNGGLGPLLKKAITHGDRAEAWYEIRYDTNGGTDLSKRRYIESQDFGVFHNKNATTKANVNDQESLLAFRMANAHQTAIAQYDAAHGSRMADANDDIAAIVANVPGYNIGTVADLSHELKPALDLLIYDYADLTHIAPDLQHALDYTTAQHLNYSVEAPTAAWVAANVSSDAGAAHHVDRTGAPTMNDLIFGSITETTTDKDAVDTLKGGAGNDFFVGSSGADTIVGGNNNDTVSYLGSPDAVTVNMTSGTNTGGFADGDTLTGIENVIGSNGNDILYAPGALGDSNILYGADGNDIITGGDQDLLVGGAGDDQIFVFGTINKNAQIVGGPGHDIIDARSEPSPGGAVVYFTLGDGHDTVMSTPVDQFEDPGTGIVEFVFSNLNHTSATFTWDNITFVRDGEVYSLWRGDGHITLSDGSVIDIGTVYGHSDPFTANHRMPVSPDFLAFDDGQYTVTDIWSH